MREGMKVRQSYYKRKKSLERVTGFEPVTSCLGSTCPSKRCASFEATASHS
jgi:hypothetical protein